MMMMILNGMLEQRVLVSWSVLVCMPMFLLILSRAELYFIIFVLQD